jgi:hypothetical protein
MKYEKYEDVVVSADFLRFEFVSIGSRGEILKMIAFTPTGIPNTYNLAFGNVLEDGSLDDMAVDNNKDRNKILATVASAVYLFSSIYPDRWIFFTGSSAQRTRLYRMAITLNYSELSIDFEIIGINKKGSGFTYTKFKKEENYFGFLIRRKNA